MVRATVINLDHSGTPLRPAIVWLDGEKGREQRRQDGADFVAAEGKADTVVEANIPADWALPTPEEYWGDTWWYYRFPDRDGTPAEHYRAEVAAGQIQPATAVEATLPHYWFTRDVWEQSDWGSRFHDRAPDTPDDANAEIEAAYPAAWDWEPNVYHLSEKNAQALILTELGYSH